MAEQVIETNRLAEEESPYLLQHASNPVNWYPWGDLAFQQAAELDRPIFLSIGYSTCHWCHVMAEESFENDSIAELLNEHFISIKVDREERPDIDQIYMSACQAMTGSGGWPLTAICTPQGKPFFVGTYFPPQAKWGRPGLADILSQVADKWETNRTELEGISQEITQAISEPHLSGGADLNGDLSEELISEAVTTFRHAFDERYGGFGSAPKFPTPHNLLFLLRVWERSNDSNLQHMIEKTLDSMYEGGIFDHIGFGFCRYSTDDKWLVPHFEKMLYDNALLSMAYLEAYQAFGGKRYAETALKIFEYVMRDMQHPDGGFYSAEDADSEGEEGKFYLWTREEVINILGEHDGKRFCETYDITASGNFEGRSIPNLIKTTSDNSDIDWDEMDRLREKLFSARIKRPRPFRDDKILTSWNGLLIAALAKGYRILEDDRLLSAARASAQYILDNLLDDAGRLFAQFVKTAGPLGYLDDYAFFIWGLLELYEASHRPEYLDTAGELSQMMIDLFNDEKGPGMFFTGQDSEELLIRPKEFYDGALPSGNSIAAWNLLRLSYYRPEGQWREYAERQLKDIYGVAEQNPSGYTAFLSALDTALYPMTEIKIVGNENDKVFQDMIYMVNQAYLPRAVLIIEKAADGEETQAHICTDLKCLPPITDPLALQEALQKKTSI